MVVTRTRPAILSRLDPWAPPLVLMGVIFFLSAQPDLSTGLGVWDLISRKIVHMTEYGLLCLLWWRAFRRVMPPRRALFLALGASIAYAATDEVHQAFVHGRHGTPVDVGIDMVGMAVASTLIARRTWR
jgi:VanZ family protein